MQKGQKITNCMFCDRKSISKEHIWSKWMQNIYPEAATNFHASHLVTERDTNGDMIQVKGVFAKSGGNISQTIGAVCSDCNNGWMSKIDELAKDPFKKLFRENHEIITNRESLSILNWLFLKSCMHLRSYRGIPIGIKVESDSYSEAIRRFFFDFYSRRVIHKSYRLFLARAPMHEMVFTFNFIPSGLMIYYGESNEISAAIPRMSVVFMAGNMIALLSNHTVLCNELELNYNSRGGFNVFSEIHESSKYFYLSNKLVIECINFHDWFNRTVENIAFLETGEKTTLRPFYHRHSIIGEAIYNTPTFTQTS